MHRRNEQEMMELILNIAKQDDRIRSVFLSGSRTNAHVKKDIFQDYDIVFGVFDVKPFVENEKWLQQFGELLIMQKPDEIDQNWPDSTDKFAYLMQFTDWNRIDLTLIKQDKLSLLFKDPQSVLLLDKDNLFDSFHPENNADFLPKPPSLTNFNNCCNEFFWCTLSVAKGLWRKELLYAKYLSEQVVKEELIKLLIWYAAIKTDFKVELGKFGRHLQKYLEPALWEHLCKTYSDANYDHMWESLFEMCELFNKIAKKISDHFGFSYSEAEYKPVIKYLLAVKNYE